MDVKRRFSPFGIALFAVLILGLLFFAFLMAERGDAPNGSEPDANSLGVSNGTQSMTEQQEALTPPGQ